jgi:hypothetical protein
MKVACEILVKDAMTAGSEKRDNGSSCEEYREVTAHEGRLGGFIRLSYEKRHKKATNRTKI